MLAKTQLKDPRDKDSRLKKRDPLSLPLTESKEYSTYNLSENFINIIVQWRKEDWDKSKAPSNKVLFDYIKSGGVLFKRGDLFYFVLSDGTHVNVFAKKNFRSLIDSVPRIKINRGDYKLLEELGDITTGVYAYTSGGTLVLSGGASSRILRAQAKNRADKLPSKQRIERLKTVFEDGAGKVKKGVPEKYIELRKSELQTAEDYYRAGHYTGALKVAKEALRTIDYVLRAMDTISEARIFIGKQKKKNKKLDFASAEKQLKKAEKLFGQDKIGESVKEATLAKTEVYRIIQKAELEEQSALAQLQLNAASKEVERARLQAELKRTKDVDERLEAEQRAREMEDVDIAKQAQKRAEEARQAEKASIKQAELAKKQETEEKKPKDKQRMVGEGGRLVGEQVTLRGEQERQKEIILATSQIIPAESITIKEVLTIPGLNEKGLQALEEEHTRNLEIWINNAPELQRETTRENFEKIFGNFNFIYMDKNNIYLVIKKGDEYFRFGASLEDFKKEGFDPLVLAIKQNFLPKEENLHPMIDAVYGAMFPTYQTLLSENAFKQGEVYVNTLHSESKFPNFYSAVIKGTQWLQEQGLIEPEALPQKIEKTAPQVTKKKKMFEVVDPEFVVKTLTYAKAIQSKEELVLLEEYSRNKWVDEAAKDKDYARGIWGNTGSLSFFLISGDNVHLFLRMDRSGNYKHTIIPKKEFDEQGFQRLEDQTRAITLEEFSGYPAVQRASKGKSKSWVSQQYTRFIASRTSVYAAFTAACEGKDLKSGLHVLDPFMTLVSDEEGAERIRFVPTLIQGASAIEEARAIRAAKPRVGFGKRTTTKRLREDAEVTIDRPVASMAELRGKVYDQKGNEEITVALTHQKRDLYGVVETDDEGDPIQERVTYRFVTKEGTWAINYENSGVMISEQELAAINKALQYYERGDPSAFATLLLSYQYWKDFKTAPEHIMDLTIVLMHKMQTKGLADFRNIEAVQTAVAGAKKKGERRAGPIQGATRQGGAAALLQMLEGVKGTRLNERKRDVIGILQAWQNIRLDALRNSGEYSTDEINAALWFLTQGQNYDFDEKSIIGAYLKSGVKKGAEMNPVDFHLGPVTLAAFVLLAKTGEVKEEDPGTEIYDPVPSLVSIATLDKVRDSFLSHYQGEERRINLFFSVDAGEAKYFEHLEERDLVTKTYLRRCKQEKRKPKSKEVNAQEHYYVLMLARLKEKNIPGSNKFGYFVINPEHELEGQPMFIAYLDYSGGIGTLHSYDEKTGEIGEEELLTMNVTEEVASGEEEGGRLEPVISIPEFDPENLPEKTRSLFFHQIDEYNGNAITIPNEGVPYSGNYVKQDITAWGYVKKKR